MSEFFGKLETELRAAVERPPRRAVPVSAIAVAALLALALAPIVLVLGSGSDSSEPAQSPRETEDAVQPPGGGGLPRVPGERVVATGTAPVSGPWEILTYKSERLADPETGEVYQPAGLRCLGIRLLDPPDIQAGGLSGQCGEFPRTPGFSRVQSIVPNVADGPREILVYGRAPEEAALVRLTPEDGEPLEMKPIEGPQGEGDFYLFAVPADIGAGEVNWIDEGGNEGSVGQELLPP
jgi:hypothetical protein